MTTSLNRQSAKRIRQQARHWFLLMNTGGVKDDGVRQQFDEWLSARPDHAKANHELEFIWNHMGQLAVQIEAEYNPESRAEDAPQNRRQEESGYASRIIRRFFDFFTSHPLSSGLTACAVVLLAVFALLPNIGEKANEQFYLTRIGEIRQINLADGSQIMLGAESRIRTRFGQGTRLVELMAGEAYFDVKKDPSSTFVVFAGELSIKVVGTRFDVRKRESGITVAVAEGIVDVMDRAMDTEAKPEAQSVALTAGEQLSKPKNQPFKAVEKISDVELGAWRNGWLIYRDSNLADVLADANRYFDGRILLQARQLAQQKVTLTLRTNQIELLPDMLAETLPLTVHKKPGNQFVLEAKPVTN